MGFTLHRIGKSLKIGSRGGGGSGRIRRVLAVRLDSSSSYVIIPSCLVLSSQVGGESNFKPLSVFSISCEVKISSVISVWLLGKRKATELTHLLTHTLPCWYSHIGAPETHSWFSWLMDLKLSSPHPGAGGWVLREVGFDKAKDKKSSWKK